MHAVGNAMQVPHTRALCKQVRRNPEMQSGSCGRVPCACAKDALSSTCMIVACEMCFRSPQWLARDAVKFQKRAAQHGILLPR